MPLKYFQMPLKYYITFFRSRGIHLRRRHEVQTHFRLESWLQTSSRFRFIAKLLAIKLGMHMNNEFYIHFEIAIIFHIIGNKKWARKVKSTIY